MSRGEVPAAAGLVVAEAEEKSHLLEGPGDLQPSPLHNSTTTNSSALEQQRNIHPSKPNTRKQEKMATSEEQKEWWAWLSKTFGIGSWVILGFVVYLFFWLGI